MDLIVGAWGDNDGGQSAGAAWVLLLESRGFVTEERKISITVGGFMGPLAPYDSFGRDIALLEDLDSNGEPEIAIGAMFHSDGAVADGALWILSIANCEGAAPCPADLDGDAAVGAGGLGLMLANWGGMGSADLDASGVVDGADIGLLLAAWGECPR